MTPIDILDGILALEDLGDTALLPELPPGALVYFRRPLATLKSSRGNGSDLFKIDPHGAEHLTGDTVVLPDESHKDVLDINEVMTKLVHLLHRELERLFCAWRKGQLLRPQPLHLRFRNHATLNFSHNMSRLDSELRKDVGHGLHLEEPQEHVLRSYIRVAKPQSFHSRTSHGFAGIGGESVEHGSLDRAASLGGQANARGYPSVGEPLAMARGQWGPS